MLETLTHGLVDFLNSHPHWGTTLTFVIAFAESLAVIGTIIPGSVTMTAIGALVGAGVMPAFWTFFIATIGALCGDILSYWVGRHYDEHLAQMWPFKNRPEWLATGKAFFAKHGAKSVIIGRFIGPARSMVPTIAGLLHMTAPRFILAAIPSAFLWAIAYMLPGVLLGALSAELPAGTSAKFIIYILLGIFIVWLLFWFTQLVLKKIWRTVDAMVSRLWQAMRARPAWHFITTPLADAREPNLHEQLFLVIATIFTAIACFIMIFSITHHGLFTSLDNPTYYLLQSFRTAWLDNSMVVITLIGERSAMMLIGALVFAWLTWQGHYRASVHWLVLIMLTLSLVMCLKTGIYIPRPHPEMVSDTHSSLPSGHTAFATALFGLLAFFISRDLSKEYKHIPYWVAAILTLLIAFSRLFLGLHWLSDVITAMLIGLFSVMLIIISYRRRHTLAISPIKLAIASSIIIGGIWLPFAIYHFAEEKNNSRIIWPGANTEINDWYGHYNAQLPILRRNRLGKAIEPLNIEWQGDLATIKQILLNRGWELRSTELNLTSTIKRLSLQAPKHRLPLLPHLYHNHKPALLMTKTIPNKEYFLVLHLWPSDIKMPNNAAPLWLGNVEVHAPTLHILPFMNSNKTIHILDAIPELKKDLSNSTYLEFILPDSTQPIIPKDWQWQRNILQIKS